MNECSFNTGDTYDLQRALSQVSFNKTFISYHLEKNVTATPKKWLPARTWNPFWRITKERVFPQPSSNWSTIIVEQQENTANNQNTPCIWNVAECVFEAASYVLNRVFILLPLFFVSSLSMKWRTIPLVIFWSWRERQRGSWTGWSINNGSIKCLPWNAAENFDLFFIYLFLSPPRM